MPLRPKNLIILVTSLAEPFLINRQAQCLYHVLDAILLDAIQLNFKCQINMLSKHAKIFQVRMNEVINDLTKTPLFWSRLTEYDMYWAVIYGQELKR